MSKAERKPMTAARLQGIREIAEHAQAQNPFTDALESRVDPGHLLEAVGEIEWLRISM